jgi:uncharacterized cupredoxin-like copper-binding protein
MTRPTHFELRPLHVIRCVCLGALTGLLIGRYAFAGDTVVSVAMADFAFALSPREVTAGSITFKVKNVGAAQHDFAIVGNKKTSVLDSGKTEDLQVELPPGVYEYVCTVPGHAEAGMKGVLTVR